MPCKHEGCRRLVKHAQAWDPPAQSAYAAGTERGILTVDVGAGLTQQAVCLGPGEAMLHLSRLTLSPEIAAVQLRSPDMELRRFFVLQRNPHE